MQNNISLIGKYNHCLRSAILLPIIAVIVFLISCNEKKTTNQPHPQIMDMDKMVKDSQLRNNTPPHTSDVYTCSMHPQIMRDKQGKCPICGMDLVKMFEINIIPALERNYQAMQLGYEQNTEELFMLLDAWETLNMTQLEYLNQLQELLQMQVELEKILEIR